MIDESRGITITEFRAQAAGRNILESVLSHSAADGDHGACISRSLDDSCRFVFLSSHCFQRGHEVCDEIVTLKIMTAFGQSKMVATVEWESFNIHATQNLKSPVLRGDLLK
jgi:hypothetical protein